MKQKVTKKEMKEILIGDLQLEHGEQKKENLDIMWFTYSDILKYMGNYELVKKK